MPILPQSEGFAAKNGVNAEISFLKHRDTEEQREAEEIYQQRAKEQKRNRET